MQFQSAQNLPATREVDEVTANAINGVLAERGGPLTRFHRMFPFPQVDNSRAPYRTPTARRSAGYWSRHTIAGSVAKCCMA